MLVSVCIASIRNQTLPYLVASIQAQSYAHWELILVVQGNDPALVAYAEGVARQDRRISSIHLAEKGKNNALNHAIAAARGDVVAFTDDDCIAPPNWLATFATCFAQEPSVGIVAGDLIPAPAQRWQLSACPATYTIECIYRPAEEGFQGPPGFYWTGGNYAVRRSTLARVGPFDKYFGPGTSFPVSDDTDFALRAEELGVVMWTTPRSVIHHTYGRRYGLANVLRHHQAYARGEGGLIAKLTLWGHRLASEWHSGTNIGRSINYFIKRPGVHRLLNIYKTYYRKLSFDQYLTKYELDTERLSRPKPGLARFTEANLQQRRITVQGAD